MDIILNGKTFELAENKAISDLLAILQLEASQVVVEHNKNIIKKSQHVELMLSTGDEVEILNFMGGG